MMRRRMGSGGVAVLLGTPLWLASLTAGAQETVPAMAPPTTATPAGMATADDAPMPVPSELVRAQPGGLTSDSVGSRAAATSWNAKSSQEAVRGAAARVDEAWASFLPRLSAVGRYTRLSKFTPPAISLVPAGTTGGMTGMQTSFAFPLVLDNWLLQATLTIPISDYLLRIDQLYTSATRSEEAARWDVITARSGSATSGKVAYYTWLRARGAIIVAVQALNDQKTHLRDARNQFSAGNASKADVLRAETSVASAELVLERAQNLSDLSEKQLRVAVHAPDDEAIVPGEDLDAPVTPVQGNIKQLTLEALATRPEVKSAEANAEAAREQSVAAKAGRYPVLSAFADGIYANPNPRYFPSTNLWFPTWDIGAQVTWSPNDILVANGSAVDAASRAAAIEANKHNVRDNIEVEVTQYFQAVHESDFSIDASTRELASAQEAYRVARELFNNGRGTSTTVTDAETDLTRARLDLLNSKADARIARIQLEHALGR
jgi:outer membrane protein